ncbi:hypothetical protein ABVN74_01145 [Escherichia coli]
MKKPWLLVAWLLVIELLAILLLIPGDWTDRAIKRESELVEQSLGVEARDWIQNKASTWFRSSVIDSGFYEGMYQTLIPSEEERQKSKGCRTWARAGLCGSKAAWKPLSTSFTSSTQGWHC